MTYKSSTLFQIHSTKLISNDGDMTAALNILQLHLLLQHNPGLTFWYELPSLS